MSEQQHLTKLVQDHESYIRTATPIARGEYGDTDYAEYELLAHLDDAGFDQWAFDYEQEWFKKLVARQARCNFYE